MRRAAFASALFLAACGEEPAPAPTPAAPPQTTPTPRRRPDAAAPERPSGLIDGDRGGFTPSPDLVADAMRLGDPDEREAFAETLMEQPDERRAAVLRAGLRLADPVAARTAAKLVHWRWLDGWEMERVTRLLVDAALDPEFSMPDGDRVAICDALEMFGRADVADILARIASTKGVEIGYEDVEFLHKSANAGHVPAIAALTLSETESVSDGAWTALMCVIGQTERPRLDIAAALLGVTADEARTRWPETGKPGLSPLLVALLEAGPLRVWKDKNPFGYWRDCWLAESTAAPKDVELLLKLDRTPAWPLRTLSDEASLAKLRELAEGGDEAALAALAFRGDVEATKELRALAEEQCGVQHENKPALGLLLAAAPKEGRALVESAVFAEAAKEAESTLRCLRAAWLYGTAGAGVDWDPAVFDGFENAAITAKIDGARLALVGVCAPHCRTRRLAESALARMATAPPGLGACVETRGTDDEPTLDALAFLETAAPDAFVARLREWTKTKDAGSEAALVLSSLGEASGGKPIVAEVDYADLDLVARAPSPEIVGVLRDLVARVTRPVDLEAVALALAHAQGLPEAFDDAHLVKDDQYPEVAAETLKLIVAGRPRDAVIRRVELLPDEPLAEVDVVDDPRVRAYLARLRERRELGHWIWATGELALMGDAACRAEFERLLSDGRYRALDKITQRQMALGDPARRVDYWIDRLDTNCCEAPLAESFFDRFVLFDLKRAVGESSSTRAGAMRRWRRLVGDRLVWSRIANRLVPAPR